MANSEIILLTDSIKQKYKKNPRKTCQSGIYKSKNTYSNVKLIGNWNQDAVLRPFNFPGFQAGMLFTTFKAALSHSGQPATPRTMVTCEIEPSTETTNFK
jgi:hypothetical protein